MEPLKRFRLMAVQLALVATVAGAGGASVFDSDAGKGVLIGGVGGILAFWLVARSVEKLATVPRNKVQLHAYKWTVVRMAIYASVLGRAYIWDREYLHGFWGAAAGLLIIRVVIFIIGVTGLDLKKEEK